ncbi:MAG TPA: hypothetical protein VFE36_04925 [Candidatus Baltobacteraceae bacterium]|nr:hypothetical protein [Candidatus Baltobacteraceae bacterium]
MRTHSRFTALVPQASLDLYHRLVCAKNLVAGRFEPGYSLRVDNEGILDLVFSAEGHTFVLPFAGVQGSLLWFRERSALMWPSRLPRLRTQTRYELEDLVEPWLRSLAIARSANDEAIRLFGENAYAHELFGRCRKAGFIGAARTETVVRSLAPYVYALRFAAGKTVAVSDPGGANGAALLARVASRVDTDLGGVEMSNLAREWFGGEIFEPRTPLDSYGIAIGGSSRPPADVTIDLRASDAGRVVEAVKPIPPPVMVSFDVEDGAAETRFSVTAPGVELRPSGIAETTIIQGSAGRIGIVVRDDYIGTEDADTDAAFALAARLEEQGFTPMVVPANHVHPREHDLIHVFGWRCAPSLNAALQRGGNPNIPIVVTPYVDDPADEAAWGEAIVRSALENTADDEMRAYYFEAIRGRKLEAPNVPSIGAAKLNENHDVRELVRRAGSVVVSGDDESARLRAFGFNGTCRNVPALLGADPGDGEIGSLVGSDDYVLVHAPIEARCNQFHLVRAAAALGYSIVLTGRVRDVNYYNEVVSAFGVGACWLPANGLTAGELSALYRRARVFADASWSSAGLYRSARAAAAGAALVAPLSGYARSVWPGLAVLVDPGSTESISAGLKRAWEQAPQVASALTAHTARICNPFQSLREVLAAYQAAAGRVAQEAPRV